MGVYLNHNTTSPHLQADPSLTTHAVEYEDILDGHLIKKAWCQENQSLCHDDGTTQKYTCAVGNSIGSMGAVWLKSTSTHAKSLVALGLFSFC